MSQVYAPGAKFDGADFTNGIVDRAFFKGSSFRGTLFNNAVLSGTSFEEADLTDADFTDACACMRDKQASTASARAPHD